MVGNKGNLSKDEYKKIVNDLYLFYRVFVGSKFSENLPAPHIKTLSKKLMRMSDGEFKRLCVAMPPSTFKEFINHTCIPYVEIIPKSKS